MTQALSRIPPGRAGRLWLRRRLATARRGIDLLDRRLRLLLREHERRAELARRTEAEWTRACREAQSRLLRAALLTGERGPRLAGAGVAPAGVQVIWADAMGARYPDRADCEPPGPPPMLALSAALTQARQAHQVALTAAVNHAVELAAVRTLAAEVAANRRRLRALRDRWVPRLETALHQVDLALDEVERSDAARLLRAGHTAVTSPCKAATAPHHAKKPDDSGSPLQFTAWDRG